MNRSSSRKDLRNERISSSPYSRRERPLKRQESKSTLSSIFNFVSSSLRRTISRNDVEDDKSVSGSEDEWNGEPPSTMKGQDVFSLAAAAGRTGPDFEDRAQTWRQSKPTFASSSRKGLSSSKSAWGLLDLSDEKPLRPSPSMPLLQHAQQTPHAQSSRPPNMFATPNLRPSAVKEQSTPSYSALRAYLDGNGNDLQVIEGLARQMRAETSQPAQTGGWSAGLATPGRPTTPLRPTTAFPSTPGSAFSIGTAPAPNSARKVTYLGPGMSPRRLPKLREKAKPLFDKEDIAGKKRKVNRWDDVEVEVLDDEPASTSDTPSFTPSAAALSAVSEFNARSKVSNNHRSSSLGQAKASSPDKEDAVRAAKKRANNVLEDIYDEVVGPTEPPQRTIQVNPYEKIARPEKMGARESLRRSGSALRNSLRSSMTASRGAAQKLEQLKGSGRRLTTLELVSGRQGGSATPAAQVMEVDDEDDEEEDDEVDQLVEAASPVKATAPPTPSRSFAPAKIDEPEPFKAFTPSTLSQSTLESTAAAPATKAPQPEESATYKSIMESAKATPQPTFTPSPIGLGPPPAAAVTETSQTTANRGPSRRRDPSAIYLSAKDTALSVDRAALPFFTFTVPRPCTFPSAAVKEAAAANATETFSFSVRKPSLPSEYCSPPPTQTTLTSEESKVSKAVVPAPSAAATTSVFKIQVPAAKEGEWECDTCMLKNPASATKKCTVCETPRAGAAPAPVPSAPAFSMPKPAAAANGEWECDTCMLKNPASATQKCTICETPRAGAAPASAPSAPAFSMPKPAAADGEWECEVCMLKNPASATVKCTICDSPKPGAAATASSAAPAAPSAPTGGFSFGKPSSAPPSAPSGGFSFGKPASAPSTTPSGGFTPSGGSTSGGFSFGSKPAASTGFKPTAAPAASGLSFGAPASGFTGFGAKPAAPSMLTKPTGGDGEWTCGLCMLKNPASATVKCTVCEAPKP